MEINDASIKGSITIAPQEPVQFVICDECHWCASAVNTRMFNPSGCPLCHNPLSSLPIANNEQYRFNYSERRGIELSFSRRNVQQQQQHSVDRQNTTISYA